MPLRTRRASTLISPASLMLCDDDAVLLSRLPEVTAISDDDLLHLVVSLERKAQRSAQGLPCLVSKAAAKAASKSASEATELGWIFHWYRRRQTAGSVCSPAPPCDAPAQRAGSSSHLVLSSMCDSGTAAATLLPLQPCVASRRSSPKGRPQLAPRAELHVRQRHRRNRLLPLQPCAASRRPSP